VSYSPDEGVSHNDEKPCSDRVDHVQAENIEGGRHQEATTHTKESRQNADNEPQEK